MGHSSTKISFPGLGIDEFTIDRVAFELFGNPVAWYGIIIAIGMIVAIGYVMWRTTQYKGIKSDDVIDFALFVIVFGVIGARLYYVLTSGHSYNSFIDVIAIWEGGLAIYGGIIAGAITAIVVCRIKKIRIPCFFDMLAPAVMIAQSIGRWGNFCNGEAYGYSYDGIFRMELTHISSMGTVGETISVHPTFLYESLWNLVGFIILTALFNKRKFDGQIVLGYISWYGLGRAFIEGMRSDSLWVGPFRISQVVAILSFVIATGVMLYLWFYKKAGRYESASYKEVALTDEEIAEAAEYEAAKVELARLKAELGMENEEKCNDKITEEDKNGSDN